VLARAFHDRRLARQQGAEILETDRAGQQRKDQRAATDLRKSALPKSPPSTPTRYCQESAHATPQQVHAYAGRRTGDNATGFFMD
jgi:hypothetical protein